ncbi:tyrosine-type recombinase/integrase [Yersinia pseudotuberculosis]|uniref:tyrosine-type recombinase/integrase n=1 Tax=Yersinia pseudotuberculosis TaxID=633 RepID=UPI0005AD4AAA|nr:site-specific integrase [Yersinia pseudotuberculosis]AJJ05063.1 phage integrase family protein [Yersinia pseudotuberculosis]AYX13064.1 DUF4102 domain-containing protein [Yersinia pseudotuberculosis]AYX13979.1 DUF4102 domain-containing protein [Yersinia pseudotuberculosis]MBO1561840.1 tyrosine-type recombinase/integrase [Yersinia pseudotuberculosis]MBO1567276.1 tyrosine-type recombinase/integrase [Yersinia pseudotuberculosis]
MALNDTKLRKIVGKPYSGPSELPDANGLSVRISPKGLVSFQFRYRFAGKLQRMKIGTYGTMSLKEARDAVEVCRQHASGGRDPSVQRKMAMNEKIQALSVSDCIHEWLESPQAKKLVKYDYWIRMFDLHVTPYVGKMIVDEMQISHWESVFKRMRENGAPVMAGMMLVKIKQIFNYSLRRNRISRNLLTPLSVADVGDPIRTIDRYLNDKEIGLFWLAVDSSNLTYQNKLFIKLVLLTGCRGIEMRMVKKRDFDLERKTWAVREELSKTRRRFVRGISDSAVVILKEIFALYPKFEQAFPPAKIQTDRPMSAGVLLSMAEQVGKQMGVTDWAMHDLRRTVKTKMAELGVAPHVSEKILGHKMAGMLAVYDHHDYIREQIEAADLWAGKIQACVDEISPIS